MGTTTTIKEKAQQTVKQLKEILTRKKVPFTSSMKKDELMRLVEQTKQKAPKATEGRRSSGEY